MVKFSIIKYITYDVYNIHFKMGTRHLDLLLTYLINSRDQKIIVVAS